MDLTAESPGSVLKHIYHTIFGDQRCPRRLVPKEVNTHTPPLDIINDSFSTSFLVTSTSTPQWTLFLAVATLSRLSCKC